jgi:uncharacterized protein (DUF1330 family)
VTLQDRFDERAVAELLDLALPSPIHALNLVHFRDKRSYRLYGLLLSPYAMLKCAKPLWAGVLERAVMGDEPADEIVVVSYPDVKALLDIMDSRYYSWEPVSSKGRPATRVRDCGTGLRQPESVPPRESHCCAVQPGRRWRRSCAEPGGGTGAAGL